MTIRTVQVLVLLSIALFVGISVGLSTPQYSKKESKACTYCHPPGKFKELTDVGKYYKEHNHSLVGYQAPEKK